MIVHDKVVGAHVRYGSLRVLVRVFDSRTLKEVLQCAAAMSVLKPVYQ